LGARLLALLHGLVFAFYGSGRALDAELPCSGELLLRNGRSAEHGGRHQNY
jgi:hypothetical protein